MTPINKSHVNQPINSIVPMTHDSELVNQINSMKAASNQSLSSISSFPMVMNRLPQNYGMVFPINNINNQRVRTVQDGHKIHPSMLLSEKNTIENFNKVDLLIYLLYFILFNKLISFSHDGSVTLSSWQCAQTTFHNNYFIFSSNSKSYHI